MYKLWRYFIFLVISLSIPVGTHTHSTSWCGLVTSLASNCLPWLMAIVLHGPQGHEFLSPLQTLQSMSGYRSVAIESCLETAVVSSLS